ncbi:MAG: peptidase M28, partial [Bryobacteraceae bacterium]
MKIVLFSLVAATTSLLAAVTPIEPPKDAENAIDAAGLLAHIKVLSSDKFEGRAPGSKGETESVNYITDQFKKLGLKPGNPNGTYTQEVPLAGILGTPTGSFSVNGMKMPLQSPNDFVAFTNRITPEVKVKDSDLVFVGYGVVAPEYGWDDYKGVDVKGKTLVFLINDPPLPDPGDSSKLDPKMFKGKAMTYY